MSAGSRMLRVAIAVIAAGCHSGLVDGTDQATAFDDRDAARGDSSTSKSLTESDSGTGLAESFEKDGGASSSPDAGLPRDATSEPTAEERIVWGIPVTGQSLAVGTNSTPLHVVTQYSNLKLGYDMTTVPWRPSALVPCGEPLRDPGGSTYPYNGKGETTSTIMGDQLSYLSLLNTSDDYVTYHGNFGVGGWAMKFINKNGIGSHTPNNPEDYALGYSFQAMLDEFTLVKPLIEATGKKLKVRASVLTHGESDFASITYDSELKQLAADQKADLFAITGQPSTDPFQLIASQPSGGYPNYNDDTLSASAHLMWLASLEDSNVVLAGPKYQYGYSTDRIHMLAAGYDRLGVKYAQVYDRLANGGAWQPMQPTAITVNGNVLRVQLHVPVLPFSFDETLNPNQITHTEWKNGRGFEVVDDSGKLSIVSVDKVDPSALSITLAAAPGNGLRLRYAMTNDGLGRRGQVADADPFLGIDAKNYSVSFTQGSTIATLLAPILEHGPRDLVVASGLPSGTLITEMSNSTLTLSNAWIGATGIANANVRFDNRNYLVQFDLPAPWSH